MKRIILLVILVNLFGYIYSQTKEKIFYANELNDYVILIDRTAKVQKQILDNGYLETFVFTKDGQFIFVLTFSKTLALGLTKDSVNTLEFMQSYIDNCSCEIIATNQKHYNNINTLQYYIKRQEDGKTLYGLSENFIIGSSLFNIVYMTTENNFELYKIDYEQIINTLIINE